jgi:polar amino acid transport system permease protein
VKFSRLTAVGGVIALTAALYLSIARVYPFNWNTVVRYRYLFLKGLVVTMKVSAVSMIFAFLLGLVFALFRRSKIEFFRDVAGLYVWLFRNTPLLVVILLTYYGVGTIFNLNRFWAATIALSLFEGAYMTEIIRSGIEAVDPGEIEAAVSLGMGEFQVFSTVVFPQAMRIALPPLIGQMVSLIKDSSLASVIALEELTMMGRQVGTRTLASFESYIIVAVLYIMVTSVITVIGRLLERRLSLS